MGKIDEQIQHLEQLLVERSRLSVVVLEKNQVWSNQEELRYHEINDALLQSIPQLIKTIRQMSRNVFPR